MKNKLTTKILTATTISAFALLLSTSANAKIYKWTDAKGVVHYTANKPVHKKIKSEDIEDKILSAAGKYKAPKKSASKSTAESGKKSSKDKKESKLSGPNAELQSYCNKQRTNLEQLQKNFRNVWKGIDGKETKLDQKQRQEKVNYLQRRIQDDCSDVK